jgi:signal transduction histidine kinase
VARDISERRRIEEDLRTALAAEKDLSQIKSNFVSMVSHEFRTPLGAIQSSAELLHNYFDRLTPARREKLLDAIVNSSSDMARMMEDMLLLSRVESARHEFHPRETSLADFCQRIVDEIASASHSRCPIQVDLGALPELARCDEGLLRHIFNNLLSNA